MFRRWLVAASVVAVAFAFPHGVFAQGSSSIRGTITDPSAAQVPGATITIVDISTGASRTTVSQSDGTYELLAVPTAQYKLTVSATGFAQFVNPNVDVTIGHVILVDAQLQIGATTQVVVATAAAPLVETTNSQVGEVMQAPSIVSIPLNVRDTFALLQLQPGVVQSNVGAGYGNGGAGVVSVNGGRVTANNYMVNGGDANDIFVNTPAVEPSPDSVQEFRVITNDYDAEYGRNAGSVVNVITKTGTNQFHGDVYEFYRNRVLNSRNYFEKTPAPYNQNQFGFTFGGPIQKDKTFFFGSYEGRRIIQGEASNVFTVPTQAQRGGNFSSGAAFTGSVTSATLAGEIAGTPGCVNALSAGGSVALASAETGNKTPWASIFPGNQIPTACMNPTAVDLMDQFVPLPNRNGTQFEQSESELLNANQYNLHLDHAFNSRNTLDGYYYYERYSETDPFGAGSELPGFPNVTAPVDQQWNVSWTLLPNPTAVNALRLIFFRENERNTIHPLQTLQTPGDSCKTVPVNQCFSSPTDPALGIADTLSEGHFGVPHISVSGGFTLGTNTGGQGETPQVGNVYEVRDDYSKMLGNHSLKFGLDGSVVRFYQQIYYNTSGSYSFSAAQPNDTGFANEIPDYLLGIPASYGQTGLTTPQPFWQYRETVVNLYGEDSWHVTRSLTLNYGLRWELTPPFALQENIRNDFSPGAYASNPCELSATNPLVASYGTTDCDPGSAGDAVYPLGMSTSGLNGVPKGSANTYWRSFAPRLGLAWSPRASKGWLAKLTGGPGASSVRMGWGMFYDPTVEVIIEQFTALPYFSTSTESLPMFNTPWLLQSGVVDPNPFTGHLSVSPGSPVDWSILEPITMYGTTPTTLRSPYTEQYNLTVERQLAASTMLQIAYIGTQGHRLYAGLPQNPSIAGAQTCLGLAAIHAVNSAVPSCTHGQQDATFVVPANSIPAGMTLQLPYGSVPSVTGPNNPKITMVGLRQYSSPFCQPTTGVGCPANGVPVFTSIGQFRTIGQANYNALEVSLQKRLSKGLQGSVAYTWSHSLDNGDGWESSLALLNHRQTYADSGFSAPQRLVATYVWQLPIPKEGGLAGKVVNGWVTSGIVTVQAGLPFTISGESLDETSGGYVAEPNIVAPIKTQNPRLSGCTPGTSGATCVVVPNQYFNPNSFANQAVGTNGNASRDYCCGPGMTEWDFAILKDTPISEKVSSQFRAEFFNALNHANFGNPAGSISSVTTFGQVTTAMNPRVIQFALKLLF